MVMETCMRGFSYMAETKTDLQYIEDGELERAWRSTRRERMKQREQIIWDNFVKEQDAVKDVCNDDPYQFIDPLPESCLKEIMENEQPEMTTRESAEVEGKAKEQAPHGTGDNSPEEDGQHTCVVTFADDMDREDMFHIFDDDQSGGEDEVVNESSTPDTVRERPSESAADATEQSSGTDIDLQQSSSKSSENVASVIESSIYCARVKELRRKINEELISLMSSLDRRDILLSSEPEDVERMVKKSTEFCCRFNRIYMYQLQRQIHDIKRNNSQSLPFAKHTQFQTQMSRIVSLHQNLLQSFMVFHKSFSQTCCVRESAGALGSLLAAVRDSTHMCLNVPPPKDFTACLDLYKDGLLSTCDKVDEFISEYAIRCEEFLNRFRTVNSVLPKKIKKDIKLKKKLLSNNNNKTSIKTSTDSQLSMYSMDTVRMNLYAKSNTSSKDHIGSSSKVRIGAGLSINLKRALPDKSAEPPKSTRRSRRPLMRDPHAGRPRAPKPTHETDIRTMVEAVETCASSHISCDSPQAGTRPSRRTTPRRPHPPRSPTHVTHATHAPHLLNTQHALRAPQKHDNTVTQGSPRAPHDPATSRKTQLPPRHMNPSDVLSPLKSKSRPPNPKSTEALKESLSFTRIEQESEEQQVMPVLTIKCAMKKDLKAEEAVQESSQEELSSKKSLSSPVGREDPNEKKNACADVSQLKLVYKHGTCSRSDGSPRKSLSPIRNRVVSPTNLNHELMRQRMQIGTSSPDRHKVTRLLKQLCSGDGSGRTERVTGAKNAQLMCISGNSPRQPSTPQLLRILEETIKKKIPKPMFQNPATVRNPDRYRMQFNIDENTADRLFQYRTKFVQHMLTSSMYANSAVGKPWEMIGKVSEQIIDEVLLSCVAKMELQEIIRELYKIETC